MQERSMTSSFDPGTAILAVSGAVDEYSAPGLGSAIDDAFARVDGTLVIDLSDVDYFPSAAVSALIAATRDAGASELRATRGSIAQRVLDICGLPHRTS